MREVPITCPVCKAQGKVPVSDLADPQTAIFKCSCGATTQLTGDMMDEKKLSALGELNDILARIPALIDRVRQGRVESVDFGVGKLMSEEAQKVASRILQGDQVLRADFERAIDAILRQHIAGVLQMLDEEENEAEPEDPA